MDTYLSVLGKKRLQMKADGYCLTRAVFSGMKKKNLLSNYLSYKQIFREAIKEIKMPYKYIGFMVDTVNYVKHLDCYEKKYNLDIVDLRIAASTDICSVTIIAYCSTTSDVQSHIFHPPNETRKTCLELSFVNEHYDLVVDQMDNTRDIVSAFPVSELVEVLITHSPCKNTVMDHDLKQEIIKKERTSSIDFSEKIYMFSDAEDLNMSDLSEYHANDDSPIKLKEPMRYTNNEVFENVSVQYVENVPDDINGTVI